MSAKDLPEILVTSGGGYEIADLEKRFSLGMRVEEAKGLRTT